MKTLTFPTGCPLPECFRQSRHSLTSSIAKTWWRWSFNSFACTLAYPAWHTPLVACKGYWFKGPWHSTNYYCGNGRHRLFFASRLKRCRRIFTRILPLKFNYFIEAVYGVQHDPGTVGWDPILNFVDGAANDSFLAVCVARGFPVADTRLLFIWSSLSGMVWARFNELCDLGEQLKGYLEVQRSQANEILRY